MNAFDFLSGAFRLEQRVQSKMEQAEALRSLAEHMTAGFGQTPVKHSRNNTAMQDTIEKIMLVEEKLNQEIDELVDTKIEIARVIDMVPDVTLRLILEKRYLLFQYWEQIALELGWSARWLQVRHREAVREVQRILDEEEK